MSELDCSICCENFTFQAVYSCSHKICYKCATRLVYLYGDKKCPICKSEKNTPFFEQVNCSKAHKNDIKENNKNGSKAHAAKSRIVSLNDISLLSGKISESLKNIKIEEKVYSDQHATFQNEKVHELIKGLLLIKCKECNAKFASKKDLMAHFKNVHSLLLCSTCVDQGHRFWYEYSSYTPETLGKHRRGNSNEPGFDGHIHCTFCSIWLYSKEIARKHCMLEHQICTVCDVLGKKLQFFKNFSELEQHYRSQHFCCSQAVCVRNHCYVYAYKSELCAHSITHHGIGMVLSDISVKNEKNPEVFSLYEKDQNADQQENLYSTGVNILNPLVNEPFFPSFSRSPASLASAPSPFKKVVSQQAVPSFLNRQILHDIQGANKHREGVIKEVTNSFYVEISAMIEKFITGSKPLSEMISEIEDSVGKENCLKILQRISFLHKQVEVTAFIVQYKKELKFPVLKKAVKPVVTENESSKKKGPGFRIIDFTNRK